MLIFRNNDRTVKLTMTPVEAKEGILQALDIFDSPVVKDQYGGCTITEAGLGSALDKARVYDTDHLTMRLDYGMDDATEMDLGIAARRGKLWEWNWAEYDALLTGPELAEHLSTRVLLIRYIDTAEEWEVFFDGFDEPIPMEQTHTSPESLCEFVAETMSDAELLISVLSKPHVAKHASQRTEQDVRWCENVYVVNVDGVRMTADTTLDLWRLTKIIGV